MFINSISGKKLNVYYITLYQIFLMIKNEIFPVSLLKVEKCLSVTEQKNPNAVYVWRKKKSFYRVNSAWKALFAENVV